LPPWEIRRITHIQVGSTITAIPAMIIGPIQSLIVSTSFPKFVAFPHHLSVPSATLRANTPRRATGRRPTVVGAIPLEQRGSHLAAGILQALLLDSGQAPTRTRLSISLRMPYAALASVVASSSRRQRRRRDRPGCPRRASGRAVVRDHRDDRTGPAQPHDQEAEDQPVVTARTINTTAMISPTATHSL